MYMAMKITFDLLKITAQEEGAVYGLTNLGMDNFSDLSLLFVF